MNKKATAIFLALLVAIMPFLGFPGEMKDTFYMVVGVLIAVLVQFSSVQYCSMCEGILERKHKEEEYAEEEDEDSHKREADMAEETPEEEETVEEVVEESEESVAEEAPEEEEIEEPEDEAEEEVESEEETEASEPEDDLKGIFADEDDKKG